MWNVYMRESENIDNSVREWCRFVKDVKIEFRDDAVRIVEHLTIELRDRWQFF
jgi:hypothetical protein